MFVKDSSASRLAVVGPLSSEHPTTVIPGLTEERMAELGMIRPLGTSLIGKGAINNTNDVLSNATATGYGS